MAEIQKDLFLLTRHILAGGSVLCYLHSVTQTEGGPIYVQTQDTKRED